MEDDVRREFAEVGKRMQDLEKKVRDYIMANPSVPAPNLKPAVDVAPPVPSMVGTQATPAAPKVVNPPPFDKPTTVVAPDPVPDLSKLKS